MSLYDRQCMTTRPIYFCILTALFPLATVYAQSPAVLQVGSFNGIPGQYHTIQAAVNAAHPGDWILIGPGTYHEAAADTAGVLITTAGIHLRGMDRNSVVVDGTKPNPSTCSSNRADQNLGVNRKGRNGIEVFKVDGVTIENLTVCNFLGDLSGKNGNQIWWNGGDGSGHIGMGSYSGSYLTASSTFYPQPASAATLQLAQYGIFASNADGPGSISYSYASNMADSGFYVGACADCNAVLNFVHAQNSAQGFSGSNAGGHLILQNSEWDFNQAGIVPSSLATDDPPSPQNGACPNDPGTSCTLIQANYVHDNNNPNTPAYGIAATVPVGTGILLTGGINNTVRANHVANQGSWGILANDYADYSGPPFPPSYCQGGTTDFIPVFPYDVLYLTALPIPCYFHSFGNRVANNTLENNGFFGNETNGDLAYVAIPYSLDNCFDGNFDPQTGAPTSSPTHVPIDCGHPWIPDTSQVLALFEEGYCASLGICTGLPFPLNPPPVYPRRTTVQLLPIPQLPGMANPCADVPENSWCP